MLRGGWEEGNKEFVFYTIEPELSMNYLRGGIKSLIGDSGHELRGKL